MTKLAHIADRALNTPLLLHPAKAEVLAAVLSGRIGIEGPDASRFEGSPFAETGGKVKVRPYNVSNGVGIITVTGSLVNRGAWVGASSGLTSYEGIQHQLKTAMADDKVKSVILDLHTPGGEAVGAFETAAMVRDLSAKKRTVAVVNGMAASAGYAIASGANEIVVTETGVAGSIGVVLLHADFSKHLADDGIKPTLIFAGAHKIDGNPFEPLSQDVRADLQAEVNSIYSLFVGTVAKGRGSRLTENAARNTEARTFIGQAAVDAGVADRLGSFESVLAELSSSTSAGRPAPAGQPGIQHAAAEAEYQLAYAESFEKGAESVRNRVAAVITTEGIRGNGSRMTAAVELALESPGMAIGKIVDLVVRMIPAAQPSLQDVCGSTTSWDGLSWSAFRESRGSGGNR